MKTEIEQRFGLNTRRVRRLIDTYGALAGSQQGRRSVEATDLLRAAVVLAHATLEDLVRSILDWKLPSAGSEAQQSLEPSNFNSPGEIEVALKRVNLSTNAINRFRADLGPMMARRHWIVHRADRNNAGAGSGFYAARSLDRPSVEQWVGAVEAFGKLLLSEC